MKKLTEKDIEIEVRRILKEYAYMDDMPLDWWMWEIIRRSKEYQVFYEKWSAMEKKPKRKRSDSDAEIEREYQRKYFPFILLPPESKDTFSGARTIGRLSTKLHPLMTANLGIGFDFDFKTHKMFVRPNPRMVKFPSESHGIEESRILFLDKSKTKRKPLYVIEDSPPVPPKEKVYVEYCNHFSLGHGLGSPIGMFLANQGKEHFIMALIDITTSENIDNTLKSLKQNILSWRKFLKLSGKRSAKTPKKISNKLIKNTRIWKSYLIVYDLITAGQSFKAVSEILSMIDEFYADVKNIENHYKNALALINGGYRAYM